MLVRGLDERVMLGLGNNMVRVGHGESDGGLKLIGLSDGRLAGEDWLARVGGAGVAADGALAFADVMLRTEEGDGTGWRMVEVKSSTSVKSYQEEDAAIQAHVAREAGVDLRSIAIAHIDSSWVYRGGGDYHGLLVERDLTETAFPRTGEVRTWIAEAQTVAAAQTPPDTEVGAQCEKPFRCGFLDHCSAGSPVAEFPLTWLPGRWSRSLSEFVAATGTDDMRGLPDDLLNNLQRRVRDASVTGEPYFDAEMAARALAPDFA